MAKILFCICIQGATGAGKIGQTKEGASVTQSPADQAEAGMLPKGDEGMWRFHAENFTTVRVLWQQVL
ncbi:hypothetical protein [Halopseudomonas xiamenensis]|uniref:hypothetical protein n=1 Tax=Halopseudomonas xiamenensis TaxID=157792 RepID=UPI0016260977|nr:hypothetical protein [Halopseudomonas xiamenensis]